MSPLRALLCPLALLFTVFLLGLAAGDSWNYEQAGLDWTGACQTGQRQTPINVVRKQTKCTENTVQLNYQTSCNFSLVNTGHNVDIKPEPGTTNTLTFNGAVYNLLQVHAHSISEHSFDGYFTPIEVHLVHTKSGNASELLVLGVLLSLDCNNANNTFLGAWLDAAPTTANVTVNVSGYLKFTDLFKHGSAPLYTYPGSLTTPGCDETVTWLLVDPMKSPTMSVEQWDLFRLIISKTSDGVPDNGRPTQALNGRVVTKFYQDLLK